MPGIQQLAQLQSSAGGGSNGKALSWNDHVYLSNGGRFLHIFSLEKKNVTAVYLFPANIWHMELDTSTQQLYVLCANYGICLLEWDESGRLVKEPSSTSQNGTTTVYNIGESFDFLLDSSVHSFTLAFDVLVLVTLQPGKWQLKLLHRQSLQSEEVDEVNTSCMENPPVLPILCCVSVQNENQRNCIPSSFVLETHLFTQLFGVDSSLLHSPIILCGFPDGQVVFFRLNSASSCEGWAPSGVKFFHHLEQPPVSIGAAKMRWRDESNELTIRSLDESPCDCLLLVGQNGSLVVMTPGEDTEGAMCNEHLEAPVCCVAYLSSGVYYATASDLFCLTVLRQVKDEDSLVEGGVVVTSVRHNIPMVAAVAQSDTSSDESTELVLLSSRGRLMLCTLEQKGIGDHHLGPETGDTGQRIKELLSGIGSVSDRVTKLKSAAEEKNQSLLKLNQVMSLSRRLLSGQSDVGPILCEVKVSWTTMLQTERLTVSCHLENRSDCALDRGWTLCLWVGSGVGSSYSFPLEPLKPGGRADFRFLLCPLRCHSLDFPIRISSTLFYSLKALVTGGEDSASQRGVSIPLQEHLIDLLQCLRFPPHTGISCQPPEDVIQGFIKAWSIDKTPPSLNNNMEPLKVLIRVSAASLSQALKMDKSGQSLCLAVLHWLLSREMKDQSMAEVRGITPDGCDFTLRLQEILVSSLAAGGNVPAIEVQIQSPHLSAVASLHSAVISRIQILLQENKAQNVSGPGAPDLDLGKVQQQFRACEPLLKELKTLRERLCLEEDLLSSAATQRLLQIYRELRDPGLLFI